MTLQNVKKELLQEAKKEESKILAEAEKEAVEIKKKIKEEIMQYKKEAHQHLEEMTEGSKKKILAAAQFDGQRLLNTAKKEAVEHVLEKVKEKLISSAERERKEFLTELLEKAKKEISIARIYVASQDADLLSGNFAMVKATIAGGLMAETNDGSMRVNLSVEELLQSVREEHSAELNEVLFAHE